MRPRDADSVEPFGIGSFSHGAGQGKGGKVSEQLHEAVGKLKVHKFGSGQSSWDDVEPTEYLLRSDVAALLAAHPGTTRTPGGASTAMVHTTAKIDDELRKAIAKKLNETRNPGEVNGIIEDIWPLLEPGRVPKHSDRCAFHQSLLCDCRLSK